MMMQFLADNALSPAAFFIYGTTLALWGVRSLTTRLRLGVALIAIGLLGATMPTVVGLPVALTNAALLKLPASTLVPMPVVRFGVNTIGDAPPSWWWRQNGTCVSNSMVSDGGWCQNGSDSNSFVQLIPAIGADIRQWGCKLDGVTDDQACAQAATTWLKATKGPLLSPAGTVLATSQTIDISASGVTWLCHSQGDQGTGEVFVNTPCAFKWIGASGGTIMTDIAPHSSPSDLNIGGQEIGPFTFHGNNGLAANAFNTQSVNQSEFHLLSADQFSGGTVFNLDVVHATPSTFGTSSLAQFDHFDGLIVDNIGGYTSQPVRFGNWFSNSTCGSLVCGGDFSLSVVDQIKVNWPGVVSTTGSAILFDGVDNVVVNNVTCASTTGVGYCLDFSVSTLNSALAGANSNIVRHVSAATGSVTASAIVRGTTSFPTCTPNVNCAFGEYMPDIDAGNNTVLPVREAGTPDGVFWTDTFGRKGPFSRLYEPTGADIGMSPFLPSVTGCTGLGTGSCSIFSGSGDSSGVIQLSPTGSPSSSGIVGLVFNANNRGFVTTLAACTASIANGTGTWNAGAFPIQFTDSSTGATLIWNNNAVNLTAGQTYFINYHCFGQ